MWAQGSTSVWGVGLTTHSTRNEGGSMSPRSFTRSSLFSSSPASPTGGKREACPANTCRGFFRYGVCPRESKGLQCPFLHDTTHTGTTTPTHNTQTQNVFRGPPQPQDGTQR